MVLVSQYIGVLLSHSVDGKVWKGTIGREDSAIGSRDDKGISPKYSGGQVIRMIKSITRQQMFEQVPGIKKELWGGEFWTDGY